MANENVFEVDISMNYLCVCERKKKIEKKRKKERNEEKLTF